MNITPIVILTSAAVAVMGSNSADEDAARTQQYMISSTHQLAAAPEQSANCLAKNARAAGAPASEVHPLYGMTRVAVVMRERPTGDTLAVASLEPANPGSMVRIGTTTLVNDRDTLVNQLLKGC